MSDIRHGAEVTSRKQSRQGVAGYPACFLICIFFLREVGLPYLPGDLKRPAPEEKIQEMVISLDDCNCEWLPKVVQDTAGIQKAKKRKKFPC